MIKKIEQIKELGVFSNFAWGVNGEFKRFNLVYGWNGSGKTTLTRLFQAYLGDTLDDYPSLEYRIGTDLGIDIQGQNSSKKIRVFNQDYIERSFGSTLEDAKPIYILGEENNELVGQIEHDEKILNGDPSKEESLGLKNELKLALDENTRLVKQKGKEFTDIARIISATTSGVSARNYNKKNAEEAFEKIVEPCFLTSQQEETFKDTLKQQNMGPLSSLDLLDVFSVLSELEATGEELLLRSVSANVIEELEKNETISSWVEKGVHIHTASDLEICQFCKNKISEDRLAEMLNHFSEEDAHLKSELDSLIENLGNLKKAALEISTPDKANLYLELRKEYSAGCDAFAESIKQFELEIDQFIAQLTAKKLNTVNPMERVGAIELSSVSAAITAIDGIIQLHNDKTEKFSDAISDAQNQLELHLLSGIYKQIGLVTAEIEDSEKKIELLKSGDEQNSGIEYLEKRIAENKQKVSTSGKACSELNRQLATFLGRDEIQFEVSEKGYVIKRNDKIAKNLSEGEKTAIAFVYFTIHLKDQDFDLKNGIVVVDDPISSMDSNSLFQAFSFLKNAVKDAHQIFIFTHNYDFLKLILNWFAHSSIKKHSQCYMIKNRFSAIGERSAYLCKLDKTLESFQSEYQYLFTILYAFRQTPDSAQELQDVYHLPNIARKFLETYLEVMNPGKGSQYSKLEGIDFDENKKTAIYKFTNDQSHMTGKGFDPSLVPECTNCISYLLDMVAKSFPAHYSALEKLVPAEESGN